MKKFILGLVLVLIVSLALIGGCSGSFKVPVYVEGTLRGQTGVTTKTIPFDMVIANIEGATFSRASYEFYRNGGGAGSIAFGVTTYEGDCSVITPVATVPILAATIVPDTQLAALLAEIQAHYAVGQFRICVFYTSTDVNAPIDLDIRIHAVIGKDYNLSSGL